MGWKSYKHRFVPWATANWPTRLVQVIESKTILQKQSQSLQQLEHFVSILSSIIPPFTPKEYKNIYKQKNEYNYLRQSTIKALYDATGYSLCVGTSALKGGGKGVFVERGSVKKGQLVALYPGTVYLPHEPLLIQSLNNSYILRCIDGIHIDGKHTGLSAMIYKSCALRDVINSRLTCDLSWLSLQPLNPLAIGQIINNQNKDHTANVEYLELDLTVTESGWGHSRHVLPNICHGPHLNSYNTNLRLIALLATKDITQGQELYSSYFATIATT